MPSDLCSLFFKKKKKNLFFDFYITQVDICLFAKTKGFSKKMHDHEDDHGGGGGGGGGQQIAADVGNDALAAVLLVGSNLIFVWPLWSAYEVRAWLEIIFLVLAMLASFVYHSVQTMRPWRWMVSLIPAERYDYLATLTLIVCLATYMVRQPRNRPGEDWAWWPMTRLFIILFVNQFVLAYTIDGIVVTQVSWFIVGGIIFLLVALFVVTVVWNHGPYLRWRILWMDYAVCVLLIAGGLTCFVLEDGHAARNDFGKPTYFWPHALWHLLTISAVVFALESQRCAREDDESDITGLMVRWFPRLKRFQFRADHTKVVAASRRRLHLSASGIRTIVGEEARAQQLLPI
jgi:hypothetical protein